MVWIEGFDAFYEKYNSDVRRYIYRLSAGNIDTADELTQETFYQAFVSIGRFKGNCSIKTWLFAIAKNRWLAYARKHRSISICDTDMIEESNGFDALSNRELIDRAIQIISAMPKTTSDVMMMRIFEESSYSQVATTLQISEGSARVLYCRGRAELRRQLKEVFGYEISM